MVTKNNPFFNASGCADPTAYYAIREVSKTEPRPQSELDKKVHKLISTMKDVANLAGFDVIGRIELKHRKSGKEFR